MRRLVALPMLAAVAAVTVLPALPAVAETTATSGCIQSVPDPGTTAPVDICYTLFQPAGASKAAPVPMVMSSHGWGGSRTTDPAAFADLLDAGFGVVSFDQRGFGESGGQAYVENPDVEGKDVQRLVDLVAGVTWVKKTKPGDPVLGAIGGSYGGGYQFVGAFSELRDKGYTRFDALAPQITWTSLTESLFPQGVARTEWIAALTAAAAPTDALPASVMQGLAEAAATGNVPTSIYDFFAKNGPGWHVGQGRKLDIPVLFGQGATDNLFPLDQGLKNFQKALTDRARAKSIFIGYNGGHTLPGVLPAGSLDTTANDPCSAVVGGGDFGALTLRFLQENLQGKKTGLSGKGIYHLATAAGRCVTVPSTAPNTTVRLGDVISTVGVGAPMAFPVAQGPLTVAGTTTLDATVTALGPDNRVFLALAVGTSPADAKIVQNNMLPLREVGTVINKPRSGVELPSVAVDVPEGQTLFLMVSPISDMSAGFGSRVAGPMTLEDVVLRLPVTTK